MTERRSIVYFFQAGEPGEDGPIKIGVTRDLVERYAQLQTGNPQPLRLLGAVYATRDMETRLHRDYDAFRLRGEWFRPCNRLLFFIQSLPTELADHLRPMLREALCLRCRRPLKLGPSGYCTVCNDHMRRTASF